MISLKTIHRIRLERNLEIRGKEKGLITERLSRKRNLSATQERKRTEEEGKGRRGGKKDRTLMN